MNKWVFRENSLDLLRLLAACQVMVLHSFEFTMNEVTGSIFFEILRLFPGVPIFFFISGYLISKSYERSPTLKEYFRNRGLRIFPALLLCVFVNLIMVGSTGYFDQNNVSISEITVLFIAKSTIVQFYNPEFMRGFGDGVLNGSLWTICVELQFYILVPFFYRLFHLKSGAKLGLLIALLAVFIWANRMLYLTADEYSSDIFWKLYRVSFAPWFYMFIFGMIVQRNFDFFRSLLEFVSLPFLFLSYLICAFLLSTFGVEFGNGISPYIYFPLVLLVLKAAYCNVEFSNRLLRGNDISYGLYIWHMPLVNQLLYIKADIEIQDVLVVMLLTVLFSLSSWFLLERNMLKLKGFTLYRPVQNEP